MLGIADEITNLVHTVFGLALQPGVLREEAGEPDGRLFTFAESCTAGLVAATLASVPGASRVFPGSLVTYSDRSKIERLNVTPETIARHGAVSAQCAVEMAWGVRRVFGTRLAVGVTGIAGPDGGSPEKPVGTVWFALVREGGAICVRKGSYIGRERNDVRLRAVRGALRLLAKGLYDLHASPEAKLSGGA
jgi:competence/damage-inducible protein CinA C-terminal domain